MRHHPEKTLCEPQSFIARPQPPESEGSTDSPPEEMTPDEHSMQMKRAAQEAILVTLAEMFPQFIAKTMAHQSETVGAVQLAQQMGAQIELFFGRDKLPDTQFNLLAPALHDDSSGRSASVNFAKGLLALHLKHRDPATGKSIPITQFAVASAELEKLEVQLKLVDAATRTPIEGDGTETDAQQRERLVKSVFDHWIKTAQIFAEVETKLPLKDWRTYELQTLTSQGRKGFELYQRAQDELGKRAVEN